MIRVNGSERRIRASCPPGRHMSRPGRGRARCGLEMPPLRRLAYPLARIPFTRAREVARRLIPGFARRVERAACVERERWFAARMGDREARFEAGAPLRR